MNLLQLVTHLRLYILDDSGGTGVDWESITATQNSSHNLLRWTNEELVAYINEAERQATRNSLLIEDSTMTISVVDGTALYTLDPKIIIVKRAKLSSETGELRKVSVKDYFLSSDWEIKEDTPTEYMLDYSTGKIRFNTIPTQDDTLKLIVYRYPLNDMEWNNRTADEPEIGEQYHIKMLDYAAYLAYGKDEPNSYDPQRAAARLATFEREFSNSSIYSETRRKRTSHRGIRYGGL